MVFNVFGQVCMCVYYDGLVCEMLFVVVVVWVVVFFVG